MVSRESKALLSNVIRHTDAHNKIAEEAAMWRQREASRAAESRPYDQPRRRRRSSSCDGGGPDDGSPEQGGGSKSEANRWMSELQKFEETLADRWGHGGYKELYPEEFETATSREAEHLDSKARLHDTRATSEGAVASAVSHKKMGKKKKHKKERRDRKRTAAGDSCYCDGGCDGHPLSDGCSGQHSSSAVSSSAGPSCKAPAAKRRREELVGGMSPTSSRGHSNGSAKAKSAKKEKKSKVHKRNKKSKCKTR